MPFLRKIKRPSSLDSRLHSLSNPPLRRKSPSVDLRLSSWARLYSSTVDGWTDAPFIVPFSFSSPTVVGHPNEPSPLLPLSISSGPPTLPHPPPSNATRWIHRFIRELFIRGIVSLALTFFLIGLTVVFIGYPVSPKFPLYNGFAVMVLTNVTSFFTITRKRSRSSKVGGRGGEGEKEGTLVQASAGEVQEAKVRIFEPDEKV